MRRPRWQSVKDWRANHFPVRYHRDGSSWWVWRSRTYRFRE